MIKIISILVLLITASVQLSVNGFEESEIEEKCFTDYLKTATENGEVCRKLFDDHLRNFNASIDEVIRTMALDNPERIQNFLRKNQIAKVFLRTLSKQEIGRLNRMGELFDDLIRFSLERVIKNIAIIILNNGEDEMVNELMLHVKRHRQTDESSSQSSERKTKKMSDKEKCAVKNFLNTYAVADSALILNFPVDNVASEVCDQIFKSLYERYKRSKTVAYFDVTDDQVLECMGGIKAIIEDPLELIYIYFNVTDIQEKEIIRIMKAHVKKMLPTILPCVAALP